MQSYDATKDIRAVLDIASVTPTQRRPTLRVGGLKSSNNTVGSDASLCLIERNVRSLQFSTPASLPHSSCVFGFMGNNEGIALIRSLNDCGYPKCK
jgi:hypothetical protein